jgi:hypothetical protein
LHRAAQLRDVSMALMRRRKAMTAEIEVPGVEPGE